jgi:hypothetical protein
LVRLGPQRSVLFQILAGAWRAPSTFPSTLDLTFASVLPSA